MPNNSFDFQTLNFLSTATEIVSARLACTRAQALEWLVTALATEAAAATRRAMAAVLERCGEARSRAVAIGSAKYGSSAAGDLFHTVVRRFLERGLDIAGPFTDAEFDHGMAIVLRAMRNGHLDEVDHAAHLAPEQEPPAGGGWSGEFGNPVFRSAALEQIGRLLPRFRQALSSSLTRTEAETFTALEESASHFDHANSPVETWVFCYEFLNHVALKDGAACPHDLVTADLVGRLQILPNAVDQRSFRLKMKWRRVQKEIFS